ncbi:hypothetical protein EGI20_07620 [Aquitalea sp. S1-19]|nr:hypothetical protein [Aquitalea sp. S1-19]
MSTESTGEIRVLVAGLMLKRTVSHGHCQHRSARWTGGGEFCREQLPEAYGYYRQHFGDDMRSTSKGWLVCCPFHDDRHPSASIYRDGGFHCHACGVHCRDVLDFHQRVTGLGFKQAAQALGAWRAER